MEINEPDIPADIRELLQAMKGDLTARGGLRSKEFSQKHGYEFI